MKIPALLCPFVAVLAFSSAVQAADHEAAKAGLVRAEAAFFKHILEHGFGAGLTAFMADDALIANSLTLGRDAQEARAKSEPTRTRNNVMRWKPLRADVAASGEMGYTWGVAESGPAKEGPFKPYGIYVIIWKQQADGQWKFVYDAATILGAEAVEKFLREKFPAAANR
jgi:ketosteroid isomerase-like protein